MIPGTLRELGNKFPGSRKGKWGYQPRAISTADSQWRQLKRIPHKPYKPVPGHTQWQLHSHSSAAVAKQRMMELTELAGLCWGRDVEVLYEGAQ